LDAQGAGLDTARRGLYRGVFLSQSLIAGGIACAGSPSQMSHFVNALIPVLTLITLGYGLKRLEFLSAAVWAGIEKITYYLMFPALLINTLASQD
jgi:hypothetical protein